ncbi:hypothetical protein KBB96_06225 [Luteolibacter ambystomatis]|uniref:6-bladed beta-propeller n=1 Tax=Luteolibacter ambystomatis TaxID=2824561 RepID=A0A975J1U8_9BACT|nr:hypothetical protein [Luteolibacter ambystomatis]QUE52486.1 hypothetical protein KBB96_06225 [Luteolibacter ambystomatis]
MSAFPRRDFLALAGAGLAASSLQRTAAAPEPPAIQPARTGNGDFVFETLPGWGATTGGVASGPTHGGIARDKAGRIYASTDGPASVLVYGADGKFSHTIAKEFAGIHQLQIVEENGEEFIYAAWLVGKRAVKLKLDGTPVWTMGAPDAGGAKSADDWKPTAVVRGPDGTVYVCDGYGSSRIHVFGADQTWKKSFAGNGREDGQCRNCHGISLDTRFGQPLLLVMDRENLRLSHFDLDGKFVAHHSQHLRRPCQVSFHGEFAAVSEILGRVTILDKTGTPVAFAGDNPNRKQWDNYGVPRSDFREGVFYTPHGIHWEPNGDLLVSEWNKEGRISRMRLLA